MSHLQRPRQPTPHDGCPRHRLAIQECCALPCAAVSCNSAVRDASKRNSHIARSERFQIKALANLAGHPAPSNKCRTKTVERVWNVGTAEVGLFPMIVVPTACLSATRCCDLFRSSFHRLLPGSSRSRRLTLPSCRHDELVEKDVALPLFALEFLYCHRRLDWWRVSRRTVCHLQVSADTREACQRQERKGKVSGFLAFFAVPRHMTLY